MGLKLQSQLNACENAYSRLPHRDPAFVELGMNGVCSFSMIESDTRSQRTTV